MIPKFPLYVRLLAISGALLIGCAKAEAQGLIVTTLAGGNSNSAGSVDGTGSGARFNHPIGLAVDAAGNLFIADEVNDTIRKVTPAGVVSTIAGDPGVAGGFDGTGSVVRFNIPSGTAVDSAGNIYVADAGNSAIRMIAPSGLVSTFAGYIGIPGSVDGVGTNARFIEPQGIAIDSLGNLYVSDNNTIRKIAPDGTVTTIAGVYGISGTADGTGTAARFEGPTGVAVDGQGNVFVADSDNNTIRKVTPSGVVTTVAGQAGVLGSADGSAANALFSSPKGIAVDGIGNIFVSDNANSTIREILPSGAVITVAGSVHDAGELDGTGSASLFNFPQGLALDSQGNLFIADSDNNAIRKGVTNGVPSIGAAPLSQTVNAGSAAVFSVGASSASTLTYQWSLNGAPISGATSATYTTPPVQLSDQGIYSVTVSNTAGSASAAATLTVTFAHDPTFAFGSWSASTALPSGTSYVAIAYDGSHFLAVGLDGTAFTSTDGLSWTASASNGPPGQVWGELNSVINVPGKNMLAAAGNGGAIVTFSSTNYDGTLHASGSTSTLTGIADGNGALVAVGFGGESVHSDLTASSWATAATGTTQNLNAIAYGNGRFVAIGMAGTVVTSPDGATWTAGQLGSPTDLYGIAYGPLGFVAVGNNGDIFVSPDGALWTPQKSPTTNLLVHVGYGDGVFVAVGFLGTVLTSADGGVTWTAENSGTAARLDGVALGQDSFVLTGSAGAVVVSAAADASRIINLSARSSIDPSNILIAGFVVGGSGSKQVLVRGVGPTLSQFGVSPALEQPDLTLYDGSTIEAADIKWGGTAPLTQAFTQVGAFPLPAGSSDTALLLQLEAGGYTAQLAGLNGSTGVGLAELYDADTGTPTARMINISARASVGTGGNILIAGFVISGNTPMTVLIRGAGPSLTQFGIASPISTPQLVLYDSANNVLESNSGWAGSTTLAGIFAQVGAFKFLAGSADAAMIVTLPPGAYTAEMSGIGGTTGLGLAEIYEVP
jgi:sugar lactone lactonase YvrE